MNLIIYLKSKHICFLFLSLLCLFSCTVSQPNICIKNGRRYCVTPDWIPAITWDACYRRGLSCMEGECWEYAISEFKQAILLRYKDRRNVRAYGMHFRDEYFPHREMGISYFHLDRLEDASRELDLSMSQTPSARAKHYLNQTRRAYLLRTGKDYALPVIDLEFPKKGYITNQNPLQIKGRVQDDQFVATISVNHNPVFIELAKPSLPFTFPVDLEQGWNTIEVIAKDLVGKQNKKTVQVYLDQQGPIVIINPVREDQMDTPGRITLRALIYDRGGILCFILNNREVPRLGLDQLCLIEQSIPVFPGEEAVAFSAQDLAGNITRGEIPLIPERRRPNLALRLAARSEQGGLKPLAHHSDGDMIYFNILNPTQEESTTYYKDIFLEGEIEAKNGIYRIELNGEELSNIDEIETFEEKNRQELIKRLARENLNTERYMQTMHEILQRNTSYYLNQKIPLTKKFTTLNLGVEDNLGNRESMQFRIHKIYREEVLKSEQRMLLAIIPFDVEMEKTYYRDQQDYIYRTLNESFGCQERFNLIEEEEIPWYLIEKASKTGNTCSEDLAQQIAESTSAEGVICGGIQKWMDGIEIKAVFRDAEKGQIHLLHDVFSPIDTSKALNAIIFGLATKFRDSFPVCTGSILEKQGTIIHVDIGSKKGVFPGMKYNIFMDEKELINKASIIKVNEGSSEARLSVKAKSRAIKAGFHVRTR